MRDVLEDYWFSESTSSSSGLEISVDASAEILSILVHFIRSSVLLPLVSPLVVDNECSGLLEVLRVASELQMTALAEIVVSRLVLQMRIAYQLQSTSVEGEMQQLLLLAKELGLKYLYDKLVELCSNISALPKVKLIETPTTSVRRPSASNSQPLHQEAEASIQHINAMFAGSATDVPAANYPPLPEEDNSFEENDYIMPTIDDHYDDTAGSYSQTYASSTGRKTKPKSGGIYKLLLEQEQGRPSTAINPTASKPKTKQSVKPKTKPGTASSKSKAKQIPMEEFIPKRHSLEPPAPEPSDAQKRFFYSILLSQSDYCDVEWKPELSLSDLINHLVQTLLQQ